MKSNTDPVRIFPISPQNVYLIVRECAQATGLPGIAPHDLRRTCSKLMRSGGAPLEQVQKILGHASIQTTEAYLGQDLEIERGKAGTDYIRFQDLSEDTATSSKQSK